MHKGKVHLRGDSPPNFAAPAGAEYQQTGLVPSVYWVNVDGTAFGWIRGNVDRPFIPLENLLHHVHPNQQWGMVMPWASNSAALEGDGIYRRPNANVTVATRVTDVDGPALEYSATGGNERGWELATSRLVHRLDNYRLRHTQYWRIEDTAEPRFFVGITSTSKSTMGASDDPSASYVGIQYSQARDANFQFVSDDGTTQTLTDSGIAADTNLHGLRILVESNGTVTVALLNASESVQASTNFATSVLPGGTTGMQPMFVVRQTGAGASAKVRFYCAFGVHTFGNVEA